MTTGVTLAQPTFATGPKDDLAVADIYKTLSNNPINSIQDINTKLSPDLQAALRGGPQAINKLPLAAFTHGKLTFNTQNIAARLAVAASPLLNNVGGMVTRGLDVVAKNIAPAILQVSHDLNSAINTATVVIGNVERQVDAAALTALSGVGQAINSLAGDTGLLKIVDKGSVANVYAGVINEAAKYGVPNAYGAVMGSVNDPEMKRKVASKTLPGVITFSDAQGLKEMSSNVPAGTLTAINPNVLSDFSQSYTHPYDSSTPVQMAQFNDTMAAFRQTDPNWDMSIRQTSTGAEQVLDLTPIQNGSPDFQETLYTGTQASSDANQQLYQLANHYPATTVDQQLKASFPQTVTGPLQRLTTTNLDPRVAASNLDGVKTFDPEPDLPVGETRDPRAPQMQTTQTQSVQVTTVANAPRNLDPKLAAFAAAHPNALIVTAISDANNRPPVYQYPTIRTWSMTEQRAVASAQQKLGGIDPKKMATSDLMDVWRDGTLTDDEYAAVTKYRIS